MQVLPTPSTNVSTPQSASTTARIPHKNLGQDDFLKLLTVQLAKQDPMKPMEDTSFIAQMAQFTSLQQTTEMVKGFGELQTSSDLATASSMLGREVTVETKADGVVTGTVTGVDAASGSPQLMIGSKLFPLSSLKRVSQAQVQPAA